MKTILGLCFLLPFSAFAVQIANCTLKVDNYAATENYEYVLVQSRVAVMTEAVLTGEKARMSGSSYPAFFQVDIHPDNTFNGALWIKVDQPSDYQSQDVAGSELHLKVTDLFNSGKAEYMLDCKVL